MNRLWRSSSGPARVPPRGCAERLGGPWGPESSKGKYQVRAGSTLTIGKPGGLADGQEFFLGRLVAAFLRRRSKSSVLGTGLSKPSLVFCLRSPSRTSGFRPFLFGI